MKSPFPSRSLAFYLPLILSVFIGGSISIIVTFIHWSSEAYRVKTNFEKQGDNLTEHLQQHIQEYTNITQSLGAFYESSDQVTRKDFKLFTQHFLDENLGILGMAWAARISQQERLNYEKKMIISGFSNFKIWGKDKNVVNNKTEYFPVTYGEPQQLYRSVVGLELSSSKVLNSPLEKSRDTGEMTTSQPFTLITGGHGFMLYYPVYERESNPQTIQERRQKFKGVVYTVYRIEDLITRIVNHTSVSDYSFFISDTDTISDNSLIFALDAETKKVNISTTIPFSIPLSCETLLPCQRKLMIADDSWFLTIIPEDNQYIIVIESMLLLLLGLGITTLITNYLWKTLSEKNHIEQVVKERTNAWLENTENLEKRIDKRIQELKNANEEKTQILTQMNYELRLPLNNILGFLEQSSYDNSLTQEQKDNVYYIQKNSQHLLQLLNKNFYFSKLISGKISIQRNMVILENLVNSISRQFEEEVKRKKLKLNYYIEPEISRYIKIDETKLRTILVNLLDNSIKFTDQGMITIKLFCDNQAWLSDNNTDSLDQENLWIEIEDNGSGIAPDIQDKVFEPFFRVNKKQGFGLGLSITSQLINLMGGKIYLSSQLGRGTIIQFYLPFTIPKTEEIRTNNQHQTIVSLANNEPNYRILVIDEQQENRELLVDFLKPIGFNLKEASKLQSALDVSRTWQPHLIFVDIKMLLSENNQIVNEIKNLQTLNQITIVGIASGKLEESQREQLQIWCDDCLYKPFSMDLILEKINFYLGVSYLWNNEEVEMISTRKIVKSLNYPTLKMMSSQWLKEVYSAASSGNRSLLEELIQQIPERHDSIINSMRELVNNFNYRQIREIIEPLID